jgi:hypothetical protein
MVCLTVALTSSRSSYNSQFVTITITLSYNFHIELTQIVNHDVAAVVFLYIWQVFRRSAYFILYNSF